MTETTHADSSPPPPFGGTAPYVGTLFKELGHSGIFPWYVAVLCLGSSLVYLRLPETAHQELRR